MRITQKCSRITKRKTVRTRIIYHLSVNSLFIMLAPKSLSRVVTKIFVFVISRKFREILISCFAKFSSSFAKFSRNTKSKFGRNFRDFAKIFDEIFVISRNINQFLLKFNKILIITPYLVDWICRLCAHVPPPLPPPPSPSE